MDKSVKYKSVVRSIIQEYGSIKSPSSVLKNSIIIDDERGQYMLLTSGWQKDSRTYGPYLHLEVQNNKVYVQYNGTDIHIADELVERGVSKEDIVLEFQPPYSRQYTGFAIA